MNNFQYQTPAFMAEASWRTRIKNLALSLRNQPTFRDWDNKLKRPEVSTRRIPLPGRYFIPKSIGSGLRRRI